MARMLQRFADLIYYSFFRSISFLSANDFAILSVLKAIFSFDLIRRKIREITKIIKARYKITGMRNAKELTE